MVNQPGKVMGLKEQTGRVRSSLVAAKRKLLAGPQSLRSQLVVSIWLGLAAFFIPLNIVNAIHEKEVATQLTQKTLFEQGSFVFFGVKKWRQSVNELLEILAFAPPIRRLQQTETQMIFDRLSILFPNRSWRLWNRDGDLLVGTNVVEPATRKRAFSRNYFLESRQGKPSHGIYKDCLMGKPCYVESVPVYGTGISPVSTSSSNPVGVLSISIALEDTAKDSGLSGVYNEIIGMIDSGAKRGDIQSPWRTPLSLQNGDYTGMEVMMVSKQGDVIFPISVINDAISMQSPKQINSGPWAPFVKMGQKAKAVGQFQEVSSLGKGYFTYTKKIDDEWNLVAISDKESSFKGVYQKIKEEIIFQLITLIGATIVIALVCRSAAKPIQLAGKTIQEFSKGNFEARISTTRQDEIGNLFSNINQTGANLRDLLNSQLAHAVTDQQIKTATDIQKGFIVETLPSSKGVELAGDFDPAYEIGADWYDALSLGDITYVVIADVCDKGIASALFMSVFRSLTRYSILDENSELEEQGLEKSLKDTISQVNDYMATNHGMSSMFATLFLGAYVGKENKLSYVCAGHEIPIIIRSKGVLENLEPTGPAIGIFAGANYGVNTVDLLPGQILFTYTDGLVDARSPSNASWGMEGVKKVLGAINPEATSAQELLDTMTEKVNAHRGDADQFDDLTMLVMKINPD
jgi:sigma-B regulation protein RsbU (phosphoserine phosphatase)